MAFAVTLKASMSSGADAANYNSGSFSVAAGDLLVASVSSNLTGGGGVPPSAIVGSLGSLLTWTKHVEQDMNSSAAACLTMWTAPVTSALTGICTFQHGSTLSSFMGHLLTVTGADNADPVRQVWQGPKVAANPSDTFDIAVLASSMVIAAIHTNGSTAHTAGTGYTLIGTQTSQSSPTVIHATEYDLTAQNTFSFGTTGTLNRALAALEINEAPAVQPVFKGWGVPMMAPAA